MKKLTTIVASLLVATLSFASTANSLEFKAGVTGQQAAYFGNVEETLKDSGRKSSDEAVAAFSYASIFGEVSFDTVYGVTFGLEYTPDSITMEDSSRTIQNPNGTDATVSALGSGTTDVETAGEQQLIKASVEDMMSVYIAVPLMDTGLFAKVGYTNATLNTKETLVTGSSYKDEDLDGMNIGVYYDGGLGEMLFYRVEGSYQYFDDIKITGSDVGGTAGSFNTITAELGGIAAKVSLGLKF